MDIDKTVETFIVNMNMLLKHYDMTVQDLSKKSGITTRTINYIQSGERKPSLEVAAKIGAAFDLTGWEMIMPSLKVDLVKSGRLERLIENYSASSTEGKNYIDRVAEKESKYKMPV